MSERTNTAKWIESRQRWQISVQRDGKRRTFVSSKSGRTGQREANAKADAWLDSGADEISPTTRVETLYTAFLEGKQRTTSISNFKPMESRWRCWIKPQIGGLKIGRLTEGHLEDILDTALAAGRSKKFLQNLRGDLSAFCKWCRKHKYCNLSVEDVEIPKGAKAGERRILQPADLATLFRSDLTMYRGEMQPDPMINAYRFAVLTGLRPGELIGLRWSDCVGVQINLCRAVNVYGEITAGKNENARRPVYLSELARQVLEDQRRVTGGTGSVFCIAREKTLYASWRRYCTANDIPHTSLYELRHTFVSMADALPEGQLKKIVGHSKSMDTYGIYAHGVTGEGEQISVNLGAIFGQILAAGK